MYVLAANYTEPKKKLPLCLSANIHKYENQDETILREKSLASFLRLWFLSIYQCHLDVSVWTIVPIH